MAFHRGTVLRALFKIRWAWIFALMCSPSLQGANRLTLHNGMTFDGQYDRIPGLALNPLVKSASRAAWTSARS